MHRSTNRGRFSLRIGFLVAVALFAGCDESLFWQLTGQAPGGNVNVDGAVGDLVPSGIASPSATDLEQLALERVNRARLKPGAEAAKAGIAVDEGVPGQLDDTPRQPVAMNDVLREAARQHSQDMLDRDYFAHVNPDGDSPGDRVINAGYSFLTMGENLAWNGTTGTLDPVETIEKQHDNLFIDQEIEGRGHRLTMLHGNLREVGISILRGSYVAADGVTYSDSLMQTQEYATDTSNHTFVLGVVYRDVNGNGEYDAGEGTPNAEVTLGGLTKQTNRAGGYTFEINSPGSFTLRFETGQQIQLFIDEGDPNIKVDFIDDSRLSVNLGVGLLN